LNWAFVLPMVLDAATYGGICDGLYGVWGEGIGHWLCPNWGMGGLKTRCDLADQVSFIFFVFLLKRYCFDFFFKKGPDRPGQDPAKTRNLSLGLSQPPSRVLKL
jgi:hypothetical protein